jgi:transposase
MGETAGANPFGHAAHFAAAAGPAPIPDWSGNRTEHRLNLGGNRQLNAAIHRDAITNHAPTHQSTNSSNAASATITRPSRRCAFLKRHLADVIDAAMRTDERPRQAPATQPAVA